MDTDVIPADKELRKKVIIFLVIVVLASIVPEPHFKAYMDQISQLSKKDPELALKKTMLLLKWSMSAVFLLLLSMGVYLSLVARRTFRSGQYPPPGMKVIRDTRLRTGNQAKRAAISLIVLASILIVVSFFFLYWPYAFEKTLLNKKGSSEEIKNPAQGRGFKTQILKPKTEIPKQVRDDKKIRTEPSCHAELVSASDLSKCARIPPSFAGGMNGLPSPPGGRGLG